MGFTRGSLLTAICLVVFPAKFLVIAMWWTIRYLVDGNIKEYTRASALTHEVNLPRPGSRSGILTYGRPMTRNLAGNFSSSQLKYTSHGRSLVLLPTAIAAIISV